MHKLALYSLCALALGCRDPSPGATGTQAAAEKTARVRAVPDHVQVTVAHGEGWLGTYVSSWKSFRTSSYWIEGPEGVILIDTQFMPSAGIEAVELAESITGKKVVAAIVLHANPDKFNGTTALQQRGIEVLSSDQVIALIPAVHTLRHGWFYDRFKPDYPHQAPAPSSLGSVTRKLELAGVELEAHVLGPGCSEAHVVIEYRKHVFVGDLVAGMGHSWLELGLVDEWLARIAEIQALEPEEVHPGRGPSGGPELLARQKAYLDRVLALISEEKPRAEASKEEREAALERVKERLFAEYPGYGFTRFAELGLPAIWNRLAAKQADQAGTPATSGKGP